MNQQSKPVEPTHAQKFDKLLTQVLAVPKAEIDRREKEYKKQRLHQKRTNERT